MKSRFYKDHKIFLIFLIILIIWAAIQIKFAIPSSILDDWVSWRQADTQTIAINFMHRGSNIFYPQINWGGNGPGYVEAEFQLYTYTIAQIMKLTGISTLPGQLLSLFFITVTALFLYLSLSLRLKDKFISLMGAVVFLTANGAVHLSTAIMPDSLSIMFYSVGLYYFLRFINNQNNNNIIAFIIFTILGSLIKPLVLSLGITQFLIIYLGHKQILKSWKLWFAWILILFVVGTYMIFSYNLYLTYGNSFGVIGGDKKFPTLHGLTVFIHYPKLLYMIFVWGLGPIGFFSLTYLLLIRKLSYIEWGLLAGNLAVVLVAMRYMVNRGFGPHYYIYMAFFGAWLSALAFLELRKIIKKRKIPKLLYSSVLLFLILVYIFNLYYRTHPLSFHYNLNVNNIGYELKKIASPGTLIVVRSIANERERSTWGNGINNFEDPRIFYITGLKGWAVPRDLKGYTLIEKYKN